MTRRPANAATRPNTRPTTLDDLSPMCLARRADPNREKGCDYRGYPGPNSTPYVDCGGDPAKHQRSTVTVGSVS